MFSRGDRMGAWADIAVALGVLANASCAAGDDHPESGEAGDPVLESCEVVAEPRDDVEVTFWYSEDGARKQVLDELVAEFDAAHESVVVRTESPARGRDELVGYWRNTPRGERPSLALLPDSASRLLADSGQTLAPGSCLTEVVPRLVPAIEASWSSKGRLQAVPFAVSTPVLLYRRSAFAAAGLDPDEPPATFAELRSTAQQVVDAGAARVGVVLDTGGNNGGAWFVEQWNAQSGELSLTPDNGWGHDRVTAAWHEGAAIENLAWLRSMVKDGLADSIGGSGGIMDILALLQDPPEAAMTIHTCGSLGELRPVLTATPSGGTGLGVAPLPGPGRGSLPGGAALWLTAARPDDETAAAWSLAAFLASPRAQARLAAATGYVPITAAAADLEPLRSAWAEHPGLAVAYRALTEQGTSPVDLGISTGPEREIRSLLSSAVDATIAGSDPAEALSSAAREADLLIGAYEEATEGLLEQRP